MSIIDVPNKRFESTHKNDTVFWLKKEIVEIELTLIFIANRLTGLLHSNICLCLKRLANILNRVEGMNE
ncbi:hypothetical protein [Candidatus Borrarchaeum sp.]|uniref:hypothetical protein n=1 Tax=Candidatus Borrarchaeum sp. TaxID=2846742 RepID=UPI00257E19BC|nr:hypothetical protein [Candidatus Borrarchaeum sp.]